MWSCRDALGTKTPSRLVREGHSAAVSHHGQGRRLSFHSNDPARHRIASHTSRGHRHVGIARLCRCEEIRCSRSKFEGKRPTGKKVMPRLRRCSKKVSRAGIFLVEVAAEHAQDALLFWGTFLVLGSSHTTAFHNAKEWGETEVWATTGLQYRGPAREKPKQGARWRWWGSKVFCLQSRIGHHPRARRPSTCIHAPFWKEPAAQHHRRTWHGAKCFSSEGDEARPQSNRRCAAPAHTT